MTLYYVEALRSGDREAHSYVVGVYDSLELSKGAADAHAAYRGGKYTCQVHQTRLNEPVDSDLSATLLYQTG